MPERLNDVVAATANFFASGVLRLGGKLGPILWQLPPATPFDPARLASFFQLLPRTSREAALLGRHHDHRLKVRAWLRVDASRPLRHALEVRHPSFITGDFVWLLRRHEIVLVVADTARRWPMLPEVTTDFVNVRLHGDEELHASGYGPADDAGRRPVCRALLRVREAGGGDLPRSAAAHRGRRGSGSPDDFVSIFADRPEKRRSRVGR